MLRGFLESVGPLQVRGWAFDDSDPAQHLEIEILCGGRVIGRARANFYRQDLEAGGIGAGDHAFVVDVETEIAEADLPHVSARVVREGGVVVTQLGRLSVPPPPPKPQPGLRWPGPCRDENHRPVFILGSARSGTSAMTHALLAATKYRGSEEGHLLDILAPLAVEVRKFYDSKADEWNGARNTMVARVPRRFVEDGLNHLAVVATRELFPDGFWLDKTPNANMIHLVPRFREIWPNARFIFMKRRGIENVASRLRKFSYDFAHNCREWARSMEAWLSVREKVSGVALEVDQLALLQRPQEVAWHVAALLSLETVERDRLAQQFAHERPQRTAAALDVVCGIEEQSWKPEWRAAFEEICGPMMDRFGYDQSDKYCCDYERNSIVRI